MPPFPIDNQELLKTLVGKEIGVSDWFLMTQQRIELFAEATEDRQWIHTDPARAVRESPFRSAIAHGFLTLSLISYFVKQAVRIEGSLRLAVNYGLNRVRFSAPVKAGTNIRARVALLGLKELQGAVEATFSVTIESEDTEKPCCVAEWVVRYYA